MTTPSTCATNVCFSRSLFTGKERDSESGNDYFGARYYASTMSRFLSPDPLMASAKVWDPQTWNRYTYGRNNPLTMIDPTGMVEETAAQCAFDPNCTRVKLNIVFDKSASPADRKAFESNQLQTAKDLYGSAGIHFDVTTTEGTVGDYTITSGAVAGTLNIGVSESLVQGAKSGIVNGVAESFIPAKSTDKGDLVQELAHHFNGDTRGAISHLAAKVNKMDPGDAAFLGLLMAGPQIYTNTTEAIDRFRLGTVDRGGYTPLSYLTAKEYNAGARSFQQAITPTITPKQ